MTAVFTVETLTLDLLSDFFQNLSRFMQKASFFLHDIHSSHFVFFKTKLYLLCTTAKSWTMIPYGIYLLQQQIKSTHNMKYLNDVMIKSTLNLDNTTATGISRKIEPAYKGPFIIRKVLDKDDTSSKIYLVLAVNSAIISQYTFLTKSNSCIPYRLWKTSL